VKVLLGCCLFTIAYYLLSCSPNNVKVDKSLKKFFDENNVTGTFALWNNATGDITVHDLNRYKKGLYSPGSSFDIITALVGLQTGKISNDSMKIDEGYEGLTMYDAFRVSYAPYFREVARRVGKDTMQRWVDSLYGNSKKITSKIDTFWMDNSFKVIPDQQLGLIQKLYFKKLSVFFQPYQEMLIRAMLMEDNSNYKLSYKFGQAKNENGNRLGWVLGWIEENKHPYFFVLNFESADKNLDLSAVGTKMLKDILKHQGFLEGKM
jgi:beta-lactamase class D